jgi:beta-glucanase (GH16 family)
MKLNSFMMFVVAIIVATTNVNPTDNVKPTVLTVAKKINVKSVIIAFVDIQETVVEARISGSIPKSSKIKYQWNRDGKVVKTAKAKTYPLTSGDLGKTLRVKISVSKKGFIPATLTSKIFRVPSSFSDKYELLWSDEFNAGAGNLANEDYWVGQNGNGQEFGNPGWGNSELQYYRFENAIQTNSGTIKLNATRTGASAYDCYYGDCLWQSAKLVTKDRLAFKYGRIEARIKGAAGQGTWPAFWTLGTNIDTVPWPRCGEIDIMELKGSNPSYVWGTAHGPLSGGPGRGGEKFMNTSTTTKFHTYAIEWNPNAIKFEVNGSVYYTYRNTDADWVFDDYQYLILNVAMGGHWGGAVDFDLEKTNIEVDYVRYYSIDGLGDLLIYP